MTLTNVIKKAERLSGQKIQSNGHQFWVNYKGYSISFHSNGRVEDNYGATCFYTKRQGEKDDIQSDYFAGTFHDNITQCFKFIDMRTN